MVLVDGALTVALEGFSAGSFEPATTRVPKMLAEEEFHDSLAEAWYRRLATSASDEARELLGAATRTMLPPMLAWLGAEDAAAKALVSAGVTAPAAKLVADYRARVGALVAEVGVDVASVSPGTGWDSVRGRGPGHPDPDACERARGDRNRMLFVE
jgi:1,2-phenylacetyl-CoA epoxidase catalytic subunit